jgi:hypothetical protein
MAPRPVAQGSRRKNFCCVTTRRRNLRDLWSLGRRCGALTARTLCLGMLGFDRIVLTPFGLPPRRLPAPQQTQAFGLLAVTLVRAPRLVLASTAFAQANPRPRSSRTGRAAAFWIMIMVAHGSAISQGTARGKRANVLLGRLSTPATDESVYTSVHEPDREGNGLRKGSPSRREAGAGRRRRSRPLVCEPDKEKNGLRKASPRRRSRKRPQRRRSSNDHNWLSFFDRSHISRMMFSAPIHGWEGGNMYRSILT